MPERQRTTTRLKALFQRPELFVLAGGINPIGAKMAEALGYEAFYYDCVTNFGNPAMTRRLGDRRIGYFCRESPHMLEAVGFVTQSY